MEHYPTRRSGAEELARLERGGVDLTEPVEVRFVVRLEKQDADKRILPALEQMGFSPELQYDLGAPDPDGNPDIHDAENGPGERIFAARRMVPNLAEMERAAAEVQRIIEPLGGVLNGFTIREP